MASLIEKIARREYFQPETAPAVRLFFEQAGLPIPDTNDTYNTQDTGYIVFLTPFGCTIRFTQDQIFPVLPHERIMQPLYSQIAGSLRIDINPGLRVRTKPFEGRLVQKELKRDRITFNDIQPDNLAYIPDPEHPDYAVVIDIPAAHTETDDDAEIIAGLKRNYSINGRQEIFYGPLKATFTRAMTATSSGMNEAWNLCAQFKREGKLLSMWDNPNYDYLSSNAYSRNYARRLSDHPVLTLHK